MAHNLEGVLKMKTNTKNTLSQVLFILLLAAILAGCGAIDTTLGILNILEPDTEVVAVCNKDSVGAVSRGNTCLLFSDGVYRWDTY